MKHLRYFVYVMKHKWFVFVECCKKGIITRGFWHDTTKFNPAVWGPYVNKFFSGVDPSKVPSAVQKKFRAAFRDHWETEDHHWQYWAYRFGNKIPKDAMLEMICDWRAMAKARGAKNVSEATRNWYLSQKDTMEIEPESRQKIERILLADEEGWRG